MVYMFVLPFIFLSTILIRNKALNSIIFIVLFTMAVFIGPGVSHDYENYYNGYYLSDFTLFPEPLSKLSFKIPFFLGIGIFYSFFLLSLVSLSAKFYALSKFGVNVGVFFLIYFSKLYLLLDLTQVRASAAISLCLLSVVYIVNKRVGIALLFIFIAFLFHVSAAIFLIVFLFDCKKIHVPVWCSAIIVSIVLSFFNLKSIIVYCLLFFHAPDNYIGYITTGPDVVVNSMNSLSLLGLLLFVMFSFLTVKIKSELFIISYKLYSLSIISFFLFVEFPVVSFRVSEFFLIYQCVIISIVYNHIASKQKWLYLIFVFLMSFFQLYVTYFQAGIIENYHF